MFKAKDKKTNKKFVAMKKVLMDNEKEGVSSSGRNVFVRNSGICCYYFTLYFLPVSNHSFTGDPYSSAPET